jgi:hypothetical protein
MIGRLELVLTLSSIRSSRRFTVEACSIMSIGVLRTILRAELLVFLDGLFCIRFLEKMLVEAAREEESDIDGTDFPLIA